MLWWRLLLIVHGLIPSRVLPERASRFVSDVYTAAALEHASADDAALAIVWEANESGGNPAAIGDSGAAIGKGQLHAIWLDGHTRAEVLADSVLQTRLWLRALASLRARYGSTGAALRALSCGSPLCARKLVASRSARAGVSL